MVATILNMMDCVPSAEAGMDTLRLFKNVFDFLVDVVFYLYFQLAKRKKKGM